MTKYPEHDKLALARERVESVSAFLDWLDEQEIYLCERYANLGSARDGELLACRLSRTDLIGAFVGVNPRALEDEKRAMLEEQRKLNAERNR